ncbi:MAG: MFS transporter [Alphaproteobacteria bacterium]|nr:MFS transporter [Alphaproteobacteria bacterium]
MTARPIPSLADSSLLRYAFFAMLYAAQGIPYGLLVVALPAYMAERGISATAIGAFVGTILLPWSLKLINGPVMDRWTLRPMGRRRPWVIAAQSLLVLSLVALAFVPDPLGQLSLLAALGFLANFGTAFQDVAVDGLAIEVVPMDEQARANGFMWGGRTVGLALATTGSARLMEASGLGAAALACAAVLTAIMVLPALIRERPGERLLPWTAGEPSPVPADDQPATFARIGGDLLRVMLLPSSLIVMGSVFLYAFAHGLWTSGLPVVTVQELGWDDTWYADVMAAVGVGSGIFGMVVGGFLVEAAGRVRGLAGAIGILALITAGMGLLPDLWADQGVMTAWVGAYTVIRVLSSIAFFATAMALCWGRVSATQYALYMAVSNLGQTAGAASLGPIHQTIGSAVLFLVMTALFGVAVAVLWFVDLEGHQDGIKRLEQGAG